MVEETESNKLILAIDDETVMLALLERILISDGYQVLLASDGVSGINLVMEQNPALILLDITMPGPDGFTTLGRIRELTDAPVIMLTAKRDVDSLQITMDGGANDFIRKPFRPAELLARIKAKLRRI